MSLDHSIFMGFASRSNPNIQSNTTHPNAPHTKDVLLNPGHATWVRLFLPNQPPPSDGPTPRKLPFIVYFHAGGFVFMSVASVPNHDFCSLMATELHAIVASVEYHLAPEHRLPAAYDNAANAMRWLNTCNDDWIREHADLSNCYIMGLSVGTNMAFRIGHGESLKNVRIKGLILHHPFFGGLKRTMSELTMWNNKNLPMAVVDLPWELALPVGADFDHEYCNPKTTDDSKGIMEMMRIKSCRMMLVGGDGDPRIDRQSEFAEELRESGVEVEAWFGEGDAHGVELFDHAKAEKLVHKIKRFLLV